MVWSGNDCTRQGGGTFLGGEMDWKKCVCVCVCVCGEGGEEGRLCVKRNNNNWIGLPFVG